MAFNLNLDPRKVVSVFDGAIDHDHEDCDAGKYVAMDYPDDYASYLIFKEGESPTIWEWEGLSFADRASIGRLNKAVQHVKKKEISVSISKENQYVEAFALGVKGWEGLSKDNNPLHYEQSKGRVHPRIMDFLAKAASKVVYEIGKLILEGSILDDEEKN